MSVRWGLTATRGFISAVQKVEKVIEKVDDELGWLGGRRLLQYKKETTSRKILEKVGGKGEREVGLGLVAQLRLQPGFLHLRYKKG